MNKLYLATYEVKYNKDLLYYAKNRWHLLENDYLTPLDRKVVNGCVAYKRSGLNKAFYYSKMEKNCTTCKKEFSIGLPCPF